MALRARTSLAFSPRVVPLHVAKIFGCGGWKMNGQALALLASIYAEVACIEGMKAENQVSLFHNREPIYHEHDFEERANTLTYLADCARNQQ
jgi:hypothetical protein